MGGYGYRLQTYTNCATMGSRTGEIFGPVTLLPKSDVSSEDYYDYDEYDHVQSKTLVPVVSKPYDDYRHGAPTKVYPASYDDEWHMKTKPVHVHGRPHGGDELLPKRTMVPVATRPNGGYEYPNSSPTKPYHPGNDNEWYRQHRDDELLTKRHSGVPVASRPLGADEYGHGSPKKTNPARDDGKPHNLLTKRTVIPVGTRLDGREYEHSSQTARANPARHDTDSKRHGTQEPPASQPVIWTDWRRSPRSAAYNGNEEEPKATDSTNRSGKPIISQDWSSSPRKGARLGEATDDIDKVAEMFIQKTRLARASEGEYKVPKPSAKNPFPTPNYDSRDRRHLGADRPTPTDPTNHGLGGSIDAIRCSATIDSWQAKQKYNGERV